MSIPQPSRSDPSVREDGQRSADTGEQTHQIECPGHGPMERLTYQGVLVRIQCRTCGNIPLDPLERSYFGRTGGSDA